MHSILLSLTGLAFSGLAAAQSSVVTVYLLYEAQRASNLEIPDITWTGSVISATPPLEATYKIELEPLSLGGFGTQTDVTVVNGASTFAQYQVYNESSTYGEFCDITANPEVYDCHVTYLGARVNGTTEERVSTTFLETAMHTYGPENRTWLPITVTLTGGPNLMSYPTAPPGQYLAAVTDGGAIGTATINPTATGTEGESVETLPAEGKGNKAGMHSVPLVIGGMLGALLLQ